MTTKTLLDVLWEKPQGDHILFNSKSELITFFNRTGLIEDCEWAEQKFHIKIKVRQMTQEELDDSGMVYDPDYKEDTEIYLAEPYRPKYIAPVFENNMFIGSEDDYLYPFSSYKHEIFHLDEENVELDESIYQFPCIIFAHFENSFDRSGSVEISYWYVTPLNTINTVDSLSKELTNNYSRWYENTENMAIFKSEREAYWKTKEKLEDK